MAEQNGTNGSTQEGKPTVIEANESGGSISLDSFLRRTSGKGIEDIVKEERTAEEDAEIEAEQKAQESAQSQKTPQELEAEQEEKLGSEEEEETEEPTEEDEEEEVEEEQAEEESEEGKAEDEESKDKAAKGAPVRLLTKDGKEINIPPDAVVEIRVDGKKQKINIKEHLNIVAGELTVNQRLGKVASLQEQVKKTYSEVQRQQEVRREQEEKITKFIEEGKPEYAMCFMAELQGKSPIQLYRQFVANIATQAEKFAEKTPAEIDNYFLDLETKWYKKKDEERRESEKTERSKSEFIEHTNKMLDEWGLGKEHFTAALKSLQEAGKLEGMDGNSARDAIVNHAVAMKHRSLINDGIKKVNPKLLKDEKLLRLLVENTDPKKFDADDIAEIVKEVIGEKGKKIASTLSKRPGQSTASPEKKNDAKPKEKQVFKSVTDFQKAFGLAR